MEELFDVARVRRLLNEQGADIKGGKIFYVRYKPGLGCKIAYEFDRDDPLTDGDESAIYYGKLSLPADFDTDASKARTRKWADVARGPAFVSDESNRALYYAFPNDAKLRGLRLFSNPKRLARFIRENNERYPEERWRISRKALKTEVVRYRPEHSAVLRTNAKFVSRETGEREGRQLYWRAYSRGQASEIYRRMRFLRSELCGRGQIEVPTPLGVDAKEQTLLMESIDGAPLAEFLGDAQAPLYVHRCGEALAHLHALRDESLPVLTLSSHTAQAQEAMEVISGVVPSIAGRAESALDRLKNSAPGGDPSPCLVHGDFHHEQLLLSAARVGILDFDETHTGSRYTDLGNFAAHLKLLELEGVVGNASDLTSEFVEAYAKSSSEKLDAKRLRWWTSLFLYLLAIGPFRRYERDWQQKVERILSAAEAELC